MRTHRIVRTALVVATLLLGSTVSADPVPVTGGFFRISGQAARPEFLFEGEGFRISGLSDPFGNIGPRFCSPCQPSDLISFNITTSDDFSSGVGEVGGMTYNPLFLEGVLRFNGPSVSASALLSDLTITVPFLFTGILAGFPSPPIGPGVPALFRNEFAGQGTAVATFIQLPSPSPGGGPLFQFSSATYQFQPTPEPATGLLIGVGLAAWAGYRRRLNKSKTG